MIRTLTLALSLGCTTAETKVVNAEPSFIEVSGLMDIGAAEDTGEAEGTASLIPFTNDERTIQLTGQTLDRNADPYGYTGWVEVSIRPGKIIRVDGGRAAEGSDEVVRWFAEIQDGKIDLKLTMRSGFGPTRAWVSAVASPDLDRKGGSFATGVTEAFPIALPTIAEMQTTENYETNPLYKEYVTLRTEDRDVVVSALTTNGFWASDLGDAPGNFSGIFVYTFNKPDEVEVGERITLLAGGAEEYIGATQLGFPLYETETKPTLTPPEAVPISAEYCTGGQTEHVALEALESSLVTLPSATVPAAFTAPEDPNTVDDFSDQAQYLQYGQWPVETEGGCTFYVVSNTTVPGFNAFDYSGEQVGPITGMLSYASAGGNIWILLVRGPEDISSYTPTAEEEGAEGPPVPSPRRFHRRTRTPDCGHDHLLQAHRGH
jgi:hypothetical protein